MLCDRLVTTCWRSKTLLCILPVYLWSVVTGDDVIVNTKYGRVRGHRIRKDFGLGADAITTTFDRFLGIPYAKPPVGELRFKPPQEPDPWNSVLDATKHRSVCPQTEYADPQPYSSNQNEDCLFLNIFSPHKKNSEERFPVMVYFHGGSYEVGSGNTYDGSVLAEMGVVVVTFNYRLGALGFLSSGDSLLPGNYGLLDQALTLKWVNQNIAQFRGNSSRVTLIGHSVGASSVGLMMVLPVLKPGFFHGVIAQSGAVTAPYTVHYPSTINFTTYIRGVGQLFDCLEDEMEKIVKCLRQVEHKRLTENRAKFPLFDPIDPEFRPLVDGQILSDIPRRLFQQGRFHRVPIIVGTVKDEFGNYFNGGSRYRKVFDEALDKHLMKVVNNNPTILSIVRFHYTDWNEDTPSLQYKRGELLSDMHMVAPTVDLSEILSNYVPVYQYHFTLPECYHSVELNYVFGAPFSGHFADEMTINGSIEGFTPRQRNLSLRIMKLWTSFARNGRPTSDDHTWLRYSKSDRNYLLLNPDNTGIRRNLRPERVVFWNSLIPNMTSNASVHYDDHQQVTRPSLNLWFLLASIGVLIVVVLLLTALIIRLMLENKRFKRASALYMTKQQI